MGKSDYVQGLFVKDGRLINMRPDGETGIAKAANIKRAVDNDKKINQIAEGIQLADDKRKFRELEY
tara:strand:- start:10364 stop:10561 length:198 start_codon:yes stop_codon:yes gene_type:complete